MYCTYQDIEVKLGYATLARLTDSNSGTVVDNSIVNGIIDSQSSSIDGYLRGKYTLPLINTHLILKQICIDLVCTELRQRNGNKLTEGDREIYNITMSKLKDVQKGYIVLDEMQGTSEPIVVVHSSPPLFNKALGQYRKLVK